jgi:hypothetical protein
MRKLLGIEHVLELDETVAALIRDLPVAEWIGTIEVDGHVGFLPCRVNGPRMGEITGSTPW